MDVVPAFDFFDDEDEAAFSDDADFALADALEDPTVTFDLIFEIVDAETPALLRSSTDAYGRDAMIFLAVASPTPGSASSSCWVAVLRLTLADWDFAACAGAACRASPSRTESRTGTSRERLTIDFLLALARRSRLGLARVSGARPSPPHNPRIVRPPV